MRVSICLYDIAVRHHYLGSTMFIYRVGPSKSGEGGGEFRLKDDLPFICSLGLGDTF